MVGEEGFERLRGVGGMKVVEGLDDAKLGSAGEAAAFAGALNGFVGKGMWTGEDEVMVGDSVFVHPGIEGLGTKVSIGIGGHLVPLDKAGGDPAQ